MSWLSREGFEGSEGRARERRLRFLRTLREKIAAGLTADLR